MVWMFKGKGATLDDCFIIGGDGLLILVVLPPPLSPLVNWASALGREESGENGTAYDALSYG
jgi:hypothetical protein